MSEEEKEMLKIRNLCDENKKNENERNQNEFGENMFNKNQIDQDEIVVDEIEAIEKTKNQCITLRKETIQKFLNLLMRQSGFLYSSIEYAKLYIKSPVFMYARKKIIFSLGRP